MIVAALQHHAKIKRHYSYADQDSAISPGDGANAVITIEKRTFEPLHRYACLGQSKRFEEESSDLAQSLAAWYTMHDSKSNLCKVTSRIFSSYYSALRLRK